MRVGIIGSPYHSKLLAEQLNKNGIYTALINFRVVDIISKLRKVDILHIIYGSVGLKWVPILILTKLWGKKVICHWIGTDVLNVISNKRYKLQARVMDLFINLHLAGSETLVKELKSIGLWALWMPLIPKNITISFQPFPAKFTIISYLPDDRHEFYGSNILYRLAQEFPDMRFLVVGGTGKGQKNMPNIEYLGWQEDMESLYAQTTVLLRVPQHDGLSLMLLEALAHGRQVIYSNRFPHCYHARIYDEVKNALLQIKENPTLNYKGVDYVKETFDQEKTIQKLIQIYDSLLKIKNNKECQTGLIY
jgi:hypothetical protein